MHRRLAHLSLFALAAAALAACSPRQVTPGTPSDDGATTPSIADGGSGGCFNNAQCAPNEYCNNPGCTRGQGDCTLRPSGCYQIYQPVCACDGKTYGNSCVAAAAGASVGSQGACPAPGEPSCAGIQCEVHNDCCTCDALPRGQPSPDCSAMCKQPVCEGRGIFNPQAYCLRGRCLLAAGAVCTRDEDCAKGNDCCGCFALPKSIPFPACAADCLTDGCTAIGLGSALPACVGGVCKLVMPQK